MKEFFISLFLLLMNPQIKASLPKDSPQQNTFTMAQESAAQELAAQELALINARFVKKTKKELHLFHWVPTSRVGFNFQEYTTKKIMEAFTKDTAQMGNLGNGFYTAIDPLVSYRFGEDSQNTNFNLSASLILIEIKKGALYYDYSAFEPTIPTTRFYLP